MLGGMDVLLHGIISDVQIEMFDDAVNAMQNFKFYDTVGQISMYLSGADQNSPIVIQDMLYQYIDEGLNELLNAFEIMPIDADITVKTEMLRGMYYMENSEDSLYIVQTIEDGEDAFINLLAHFTGQTQDYFFPHVSGFDTAYLNKLYDLHKRQSEVLVEDIAVANDEAIARCKTFLAGHMHTLMEIAFKEDMYKPGVAYQILFNKYKPNLDALYPEALNQLAIEVIGLLCLSGVPNKGFRQEVKNRLSELVQDEAAIARTTVEVDRLLMEIGLYA